MKPPSPGLCLHVRVRYFDPESFTYIRDMSAAISGYSCIFNDIRDFVKCSFMKPPFHGLCSCCIHLCFVSHR